MTHHYSNFFTNTGSANAARWEIRARSTPARPHGRLPATAGPTWPIMAHWNAVFRATGAGPARVILTVFQMDSVSCAMSA